MSTFTNLFAAITGAVAASQKKPRRRNGGVGGGRRGKPECTPCAANAYVESLRPKTPKR